MGRVSGRVSGTGGYLGAGSGVIKVGYDGVIINDAVMSVICVRFLPARGEAYPPRQASTRVLRLHRHSSP